MPVAATRGLCFFGLWLVLSGKAGPADLAMGALAATLATRVSLRLLPPSRYRIAPRAALRLGLGILRASALAGLDIALRALDPKLPIRPGLVAVPLGLPPGLGRDGFCLLTSLQPGALPVGSDAEGRLLVHALDTGLPVARETLALEASFAAAVGEAGRG